MYGQISAKKYFSAGEWLRLVKKKISRCIVKKKTPILVGGTGLYFNAITNGISKIPFINKKTKNIIRKMHLKIGQDQFYKRLIILDPLVKNKISPTDTQRSIRAYEVKKVTKKSIYEWALLTKSDFLNYDIKKIFLDYPKDYLLKKIEKRTQSMFKKGCINEVKFFLKLNIDKSLSVNKLIGINEINSYLLGKNDLDKTKELIIIKTRQYAKSQKTWSRGHMKNWNKLYYKDSSILEKKVLKHIS